MANHFRSTERQESDGEDTIFEPEPTMAAVAPKVIDDAEVRNGVREDGTIYSVYSFARKLGQAFSSGLVGALLGIIGYSEATAFDPAVTRGIFNMACIAPIIGFVAIVLALAFLYPLGKKKVEENVAILAERHAK